ATAPYIYTADVPSVQADVRSLKNRVLTLRQQAAAGQPATLLKQTLGGMIGDYQDAFNRWSRIATGNPSLPQLAPIGDTLNRVEQLINQALASGQLVAAGPTRIAQDLAQLTGEVNDARRSLTAIPGYPQQQSIGTYLEQLAGYIQQLNGALTQQTT